MTREKQVVWTYPGSRWWKFDFHTHTPASRDTTGWQQALDTPGQLTPENWLCTYMSAGIDCVAVTDHNSGAWIDKLKAAYEQMKQQADGEQPPDNFRELTIFPGVEISVNGGFHLLAIFDPSATTRTITDLLASVHYEGTDGDSDGVTRDSPVAVVRAVLSAGGIPIPAHADQKKGLLQVNPGSRTCALDGYTVRQVMTVEDLLAVEWLDTELPLPTFVEGESRRLARVLGSDCHSFNEGPLPGSSFTWIKMASPTLEGLRLALLDGNGISVQRSDEGNIDPFRTPAHFIARIEIDSARYMGNGKPEHVNFAPYYNALVGGRGTGKSTIVHTLRLAYRRKEELRNLGENSEPYRQFTSFIEPVSSRDSNGALRDNTEVRIELWRDGIRHLLRWRQDGQGTVIEESDKYGEWRASSSQAVTPERFPVRLFAQGQIAAMAGEGRQALLDVIDEAANVSDLHRSFGEARQSYFSKRAQLRELEGRLEGRSEVERKLADLDRKLDALTLSDHAEVLKAHQRALQQRREIESALEHLQKIPGDIGKLVDDFLLDDWPEGMFDAEQDHDALAWRQEAEQVLRHAQEHLEAGAHTLAKLVKGLESHGQLKHWRQRAARAEDSYQTLQATLAKQGITDSREFGSFVQKKQELETQLKHLERLRQEQAQLEAEICAQWNRVLAARKAITRARHRFVTATLANNRFVRMEVVRFGFEARSIERSLRTLLECPDDRFERDILESEDGEPSRGLAFDLANADDQDRAAVLEQTKGRLIKRDKTFGGHFRNYLDRKLERPEFTDHVRCWFPDDDLRIEYSRKGDGSDWSFITQGSQGQRSAALLAFLLAFGEEPLVLDQPEDDLDNHLIYELIVRQIRENKLRRQLIIITHNPNVVVNGDAEMVHAFNFRGGQCRVVECGALQQKPLREEVCRVMEGGREAFSRRWARLGREV